jgi:hypothetical protein
MSPWTRPINTSRALDLAFRNLSAFRAGRALRNTIDVSHGY